MSDATILSFLRRNLPWLAAGVLLSFSSSFGQTFFISLFGGQIRAEFGLSNGEFGWIYLLGTLASATLMVLVGKVVDHYSPRRVGVAVILGLSVACIAMAFAKSWVALVFAIFMLRFFGQGMMSHTALTAMGRWFDANRGKAVSITNTGHQLGEAILPLVVVVALVMIEWRQAWQLNAVFLAVILAPALSILLAKDRVPQNTTAETKLEVSKHWSRSEMLKDKLFWLASFGYLAPPFIGTSIFFHQVYMVEVKGWELIWFAGGFSIYAVSTVISGLATGALVDRLSARVILPYFLVPLVLSLLVLGTWSSPIIIPIAMILLGINGGGFSTLFGALWPEVYGTRHLGEIRSIIVAGMVFASALGPGVTGWMLDLGVTLDILFFSMAIYCIAVSVMLFGVSKQLVARQDTASQ